jgi:hypothetical protein
MNTYYYDIDGGDSARKWEEIVSPAIQKLTIDQTGSDFTPSPNDGVVFIHHTSLQCTEESAKVLTEKHPNTVFVWIYGAGLPNGPSGDRHYCVRAVITKPRDERFSVRVRKFLSDFEASGKPTFTLLEPRNRESLFALRLLCESWLLLHWNEGAAFLTQREVAKALQIDPAGYTLPAGIQLTPPSSPPTWTAPFGKGSVETIVNELTSEDAKGAVRSFFADMSGAQPDFARVADLYLLLDAAVRASS